MFIFFFAVKEKTNQKKPSPSIFAILNIRLSTAIVNCKNNGGIFLLPSFDNIQKYCISLQRKLLFHLSNCVIGLEHSFEGGKRIVKGAGGQSKVPPVPLTKNSLTSDKKIAEKEQTRRCTFCTASGAVCF